MFPELGLAEIYLFIPTNAIAAGIGLDRAEEPLLIQRPEGRFSQKGSAVIDPATAVHEGHQQALSRKDLGGIASSRALLRGGHNRQENVFWVAAGINDREDVDLGVGDAVDDAPGR